MFFSYPQWLGQAPDPSMTIPPQPTFRPAHRQSSQRQGSAPVAAAAENSNSSTSSGPSDSNSDHDLYDNSHANWERVNSVSDKEANIYSYDTYATEEYILPPEAIAAEGSQPTAWTNDIAHNETEDARAYYTSGHAYKPENAGQPPSYQESETYFYRLSHFYPFICLSHLDYAHTEHSLPFFRNQYDNVIYDAYRKDSATPTHSRDYARDRQSKGATWSSPPISSFKWKKTTSERPKETISDETKKSPKLGTYSFTFFSQRETFPTVSPDSRSFDTIKNTIKSQLTTPSGKPFIYRKPLTLKDALSQYEEHWTILSDVDTSVKWTFHTIPWPQFPSPISIEDINSRKIQRFLLAGDINLKVSLRKALLRFHPDKIPKLLVNVEGKDKEQVSQGCMTVAKCLNEIKGKL